MKYLELIDNYNDDKVWCVKVYNRGEVYFNQKIKGNLFNSRYKRTTKKYLNEYLQIELNEEIEKLDEELRPKEELIYRDRFISKCRTIEESILNESLPF
jgi:hypothetical protein